MLVVAVARPGRAANGSLIFYWFHVTRGDAPDDSPNDLQVFMMVYLAVFVINMEAILYPI